MRCGIVIPFTVFSLVFFVTPAFSRTCEQDLDCDSAQVCLDGSCLALSPKEAIVEVKTDTPDVEAVLYINDTTKGVLPWVGVVRTGVLDLRIEAEGYEIVRIQGEAHSGAREIVHVRLVSLDETDNGLSAVSFTKTDDDAAGSTEIGRFYIGILGSGGYGIAAWGDSKTRPVGSLLGGGTFGLRLIESPFWLELGASVMYGTRYVKDWPTVGDQDVQTLHLGLLPRILFPLVDELLYIGAEVEPGFVVSNRTWFYLGIRAGLAIMVHKNVEIRINPLGLEWLQDLKGKGMFVNYNATLGLAFRFL
jgi:hypothetical protein